MARSMRQPKDRSSVTINLRAPRRQRDVIDRAARALGKSRTEFMLESAGRAAEDALLDRRLFSVDAATYDAFAKILDRPPAPNARLRALLARRGPWER